jgi:hypothetical protein
MQTWCRQVLHPVRVRIDRSTQMNNYPRVMIDPSNHGVPTTVSRPRCPGFDPGAVHVLTDPWTAQDFGSRLDPCSDSALRCEIGL